MLLLRTAMRLLLIPLLLVCLVACSAPTLRQDGNGSTKHFEPEPVLIIYHVKRGSEKELESLLAQAWGLYQRNHMVFHQPHVCVRVREDGNNVRFVEVFTWVSYFATEHPPDSVNKLWHQMELLCEERHGNRAVEVRQAELLK